MEEQSELAERILDQVADAVICANDSGTIIRWNHASAALFGYSAKEALGQSVELIIPDHLRAAHRSGFDAAMTRGATTLQGRPTLTRAVHKSGRKLYVEMSFAIVKGDTESEVLGAVAVARDVTERIERERAASRSSTR
jgi:PAS domain S-box-containing protein